MARLTIDDQKLVETLFGVFRTYGYEAATISQLSAATGLKKSSLYHRFPAGKEDMAVAVVSYVNQQLQQYLIDPLRDQSQTVERRFDHMIQVLVDFYADGKKNCLLNVLNLGEPSDQIRGLLKQGFEACRNALAGLACESGFSDTEAHSRADYFFILMEGALVIQRLECRAGIFQKSLMQAKQLFFSKEI